MLAHKLFQKKFDQKFLVTAWSTGATVVFESLILKPYQRDKPAQRFRHNGFGATVALKKTTERKYKCSFSDQDRLAI